MLPTRISFLFIFLVLLAIGSPAFAARPEAGAYAAAAYQNTNTRDGNTKKITFQYSLPAGTLKIEQSAHENTDTNDNTRKVSFRPNEAQKPYSLMVVGKNPRKSYGDVFLGGDSYTGYNFYRVSFGKSEAGGGVSVSLAYLDDETRGAGRGGMKFGAAISRNELALGATASLGPANDQTAGRSQYFQVSGKKDSIGVGLIYLYAPGQTIGDSGTAALVSLPDIGMPVEKPFPLTILSGRENMLGGTGRGDGSDAGVRSLGLTADIRLSDVLSLYGSMAYARTGTRPAASASADLGWEYNLGASYQLRDNLSYRAHFGYFAPGDFLKDAAPKGPQVNSIYLLTNQITMTF